MNEISKRFYYFGGRMKKIPIVLWERRKGRPKSNLKTTIKHEK